MYLTTMNKWLAVCALLFAQQVNAQKLTFEIPTKIQATVGLGETRA